MILCVYEGKRENKWFLPITHQFLKGEVVEYFIVEGTFHRLYKRLLDNGWDTLEALRDIESRRDEKRLLEYKESDFSEVFLFFFYDPHSYASLNQLDSELREMLAFFDNETEHGKMYVNYPMIESLRYTKELPDINYYLYTVPFVKCSDFKQISAVFSAYPNNDFVDARGNYNAEDAIRNWNLLKLQNVAKANYICHGSNNLPENKNDVSQQMIHNAQVKKYGCSDKPCVAILAAYPMFLYEYLKD